MIAACHFDYPKRSHFGILDDIGLHSDFVYGDAPIQIILYEVALLRDDEYV